MFTSATRKGHYSLKKAVNAEPCTINSFQIQPREVQLYMFGFSKTLGLEGPISSSFVIKNQEQKEL